MLELQNAKKLEDFFELDIEKGAINSRSRSNRVFILGSQAWAGLLNAVYGKFSSGAAVILYDMGKPYGVEIAKDLGLNKMLTSLDISKIGRISGWGKFSAQGDFEFGKFFKFTIGNCVFCLFDTNHEPCQFARGTLEGMASSVFNKQYESYISCNWGSAEHHCEIILKEKKVKGSK